MRAVVVALGKVGLPLAARIALAGHEVVGADIDPRVVDAGQRGQAPFPNEAGLPEALARDRRRRPPARGEPTPPPPWPRGRTSSSRSRRWSSTRAPARTGAILDAVVADIGRGLQAGTTVSIETTVPVGTTRAPGRPGAGGRVRPARGHRLPRGLLARADLQRARDRRPRQVPQAGRRPQRRRRGARHRVVRVVPRRRGPRPRAAPRRPS